MSERNFSRRRRGGMRFRPSGGFGNKPDRSAQEARAEATGEKKPEALFERARHDEEIERAENIAAGLPPKARRAAEQERRRPNDESRGREGRFPPAAPGHARPKSRRRNLSRCPLQTQPQGLVSTIKTRVDKVIKKVQRFIKPEEKTHKEIIINAESLETRVAVQEDGRLEEFTIERTTEERLVGSIFKGKVRNLEDGLKAAFVDIGFEKNAFLHYWDIVPTF